MSKLSEDLRVGTLGAAAGLFSIRDRLPTLRNIRSIGGAFKSLNHFFLSTKGTWQSEGRCCAHRCAQKKRSPRLHGGMSQITK